MKTMLFIYADNILFAVAKTIKEARRISKYAKIQGWKDVTIYREEVSQEVFSAYFK